MLALPYVSTRGQTLRYPEFLVRRVFRIYPAYWVAVGLSMAMIAPSGPASRVE